MSFIKLLIIYSLISLACSVNINVAAQQVDLPTITDTSSTEETKQIKDTGLFAKIKGFFFSPKTKKELPQEFFHPTDDDVATHDQELIEEYAKKEDDIDERAGSVLPENDVLATNQTPIPSDININEDEVVLQNNAMMPEEAHTVAQDVTQTHDENAMHASNVEVVPNDANIDSMNANQQFIDNTQNTVASIDQSNVTQSAEQTNKQTAETSPSQEQTASNPNHNSATAVAVVDNSTDSKTSASNQAPQDSQDNMRSAAQDTSKDVVVNVKVKGDGKKATDAETLKNQINNIIAQSSDTNAQKQKEVGIDNDQMMEEIITKSDENAKGWDLDLDFVQLETRQLLLPIDDIDQTGISQEALEENMDFFTYAKSLEQQILYLARFEKRTDTQSFLRYSMRQMQKSSDELEKMGIGCE